MRLENILSIMFMIFMVSLMSISCTDDPQAVKDYIQDVVDSWDPDEAWDMTWDMDHALGLSQNGSTIMFSSNGSTLSVPGGNACPELFDWEDNGTIDLAVGTGEGEIYVLENSSTDGFSFVNGYAFPYEVSPGEWDRMNFGQDAAPVILHQQDGDASWEMQVGTRSGKVTYYDIKAVWPFEAETVVLAADGESITVPGGNARPAVTDYLGGSLSDLLIGSGYGTLHKYETARYVDHPEFTGRDKMHIYFGHRASPYFQDLDGSGVDDLLIGNAAGEIYVCSGPDYKADDCIEVGKMVESNACPAAADVNHDGHVDLVIGTGEGRVFYIPATFSSSQ